MGINAPGVHIDITTKVTSFNQALRRVRAGLVRTKQAMDVVARKARRMFLIAGAAATAGIISFVGYEKQMSRVKALTDATESQFRRLNQTAQMLGKSTVYSAREAAAAMSAFALSGFEVNQIIGAMKPTLDLAAVGQLDMATAARITAGVMRGMKLEVSDLEHVVDVLAKASTTAATDIPQLGEAMKNIGPVASASGISLEEMAASLQILANVMIQGGQAGTKMRNIMIRLQSQPAEAQKRFKELGITIEDSQGKMKKLATIIDELKAAMKSKTDMQKSAIIFDIAGMRAIDAMTRLLDVGGDELRKYTEALAGAGGTAQKVADTQLDNLWGRFKIILSAVEGLSIKLGTKLKPALDMLARKVSKVVAAIDEWSDRFDVLVSDRLEDAIEGIIDFVAQNKNVILVTIKWTALLGVATIVLTKFVTLMQGLIGIVIALGVKWSLLAGGIGVFVAAVVAAKIKVAALNAELRESSRESKRLAESFNRLTEAKRGFFRVKSLGEGLEAMLSARSAFVEIIARQTERAEKLKERAGEMEEAPWWKRKAMGYTEQQAGQLMGAAKIALNAAAEGRKQLEALNKKIEEFKARIAQDAVKKTPPKPEPPLMPVPEPKRVAKADTRLGSRVGITDLHRVISETVAKAEFEQQRMAVQKTIAAATTKTQQNTLTAKDLMKRLVEAFDRFCDEGPWKSLGLGRFGP